MNANMTRRAALQGAGALLAAAPAELAEAAPATLRLRLMGTSDLHANIFPYDYYKDRADDSVGLARTANLIRTARAEVANSMLIDNGDILQGTPLGDFAAAPGNMQPGQAHPMIGAMNVLGYSACTLGNHEFNYGLELLESALKGANFPAVCCNIFKPDGGAYFTPWILIDKRCADSAKAEQILRIGLIGFVPPQIVQWDQTHLQGRATTMGIVEAAQKYVPQLRAAGADLVIALCHSGVSRRPPPEPGEENAALGLSQVPGIDAMFLGHQHLLLPGADFVGIAGVDNAAGALNGVPAFMPGFWGSHLGIIDLDLARTGGQWKIAAAKVELRPIYARNGAVVTPLASSEADVLAAAQGAHEATLNYVRAPVGDLASPISSYFALIADDPSVQIVNAAQNWYLKRLALSTPALSGQPILSAAAPFKVGGRGGPDYFTNVAAGPIAIRNAADLYLYPNTLRAVKIDGATLREWLERSAGAFKRIDPASRVAQELLEPAFPAYNFDVIDGVTYAIDVTQPSRYDADGKLVAPEAHRIVDLRFEGRPVDPKQLFLVATNNYRAGGGGNFPGCDGASIVFEAPDANREILIRYIVETKHVEPKADGNWRFQPWPPAAVVTFFSSPLANDAPKPPGVKVTLMGPAPGGFALYRLELT